MNTASSEKAVLLSPSLSWAWARACQLEGAQDAEPIGPVWRTTYQRILKGWGSLTDPADSNRATHWPPLHPSQLDEVAKQHRIDFYYRVWSSADVIKASAMRGHSVSAAFYVTQEWEQTEDGKLDFAQVEDRIIGGHVLGISLPWYLSPVPAGWDGDNFFVFQNSWGPKWGSHGWGAMSHEFFDSQMYEAWAMPWDSEMPPLYGNGIQHISWEIKRDRDRQFYLFDIVDADSDNRIAWATVVHHRGELHVEELFVKPEARGKGHGNALLKMIDSQCKEALAVGIPIKFWIPFADVDNSEKARKVKQFFDRHGFRIIASPVASAAYVATLDEPLAELPPLALPPKPAYVFAAAKQPIDWQQLKQAFSVDDQFIESAKRVFERHAETLKRLA
jgi:GNAT superfamily N-acetyltransferase